MSRIRGVLGHELVSKISIHWLSKYEHEFLGWAQNVNGKSWHLHLVRSDSLYVCKSTFLDRFHLISYFSCIRQLAIYLMRCLVPVSFSLGPGQPGEATVVKMAPTRPLASRSFCLLAFLCDHRSLSNLQQGNTWAWYTLHQNDRLVPFLVFVR